MWRLIIFFVFLNSVLARKDDEPKTRTVITKDGAVVGTKYWDGDYYEFFGIPYAEAPTGRDRFQAPRPVKPWKDAFVADNKNMVCYQSYFTDEDEDFMLSGEDDCLVINLWVPEVASEKNLVPVVIYIHSGAFSGGNGYMARFNYLARHDVIVISFNYRLGAIGFACLGNKEIPGNAGLKDQVAALRWIKKNIKAFGGDPNKVTLAGYSVGAAMAELLTLSKTTDGLINQLILESGSALSPFAINRDPIATATNLAYAMGYNGSKSLDELTEFYLEAPISNLTAKSLNFFLPNSTFGFAPCVENVHEGIEPFLTESPTDIFKKGGNTKIPILTGFSNMEGISRTIKFGEWRDQMNEDFAPFLPADLTFDSEASKEALIKEIKQRYFKGNEVTHEQLQGYVDYFSAAMFKYSIMKSLRLHAASSKGPIYFYEFSYVGKLNMQHKYVDKIKGASHRDQTAYLLDFFGWTNSYKDLDMRERMTTMWTDFVKFGDPTAYESLIINYKWVPYTNENQYYLHIGRKQSIKKNLFVDEYNFWNKIYEKYYWNPTAPVPPKVEAVKKVEVETRQKENDVVKTAEKIVVENAKDADKPNIVNENTKTKMQATNENKIIDKVEKKPEPIKENKKAEDVKKEENKEQPTKDKKVDGVVKEGKKKEAIKENKPVNVGKDDSKAKPTPLKDGKKPNDNNKQEKVVTQKAVKENKVIKEAKKEKTEQKPVEENKETKQVKKEKSNIKQEKIKVVNDVKTENKR